MFLFLFGLPGTGKNYIGQVLESEFGFSFFDCDDVIQPEMMDVLRQGRVPSKALEDQYYEVICQEIEARKKAFHNLVVGEALLYNPYRVLLQQQFPDFVFVLITCDRSIRVQRCNQRNHLLV